MKGTTMTIKKIIMTVQCVVNGKSRKIGEIIDVDLSERNSLVGNKLANDYQAPPKPPTKAELAAAEAAAKEAEELAAAETVAKEAEELAAKEAADKEAEELANAAKADEKNGETKENANSSETKENANSAETPKPLEITKTKK